MTALGFAGALALVLAVTVAWGARTLTQEHWQFVAAFPVRRHADGTWTGVNVTWYGVFVAAAAVAGAILLTVLLGSIGVPPVLALLMLLALMAACFPAARLIARFVEGKHHTFTMGGAFFVGVLLAPLVVRALDLWLAPALGSRLPIVPALAAVGVAYAFGESIGRLGCISFGCCYGRPLATAPQWIRVLFAHWHFRFIGATKKIAYAGALEGAPVVPIQSVTSMVFGVGAVISAYLFLRGQAAAALLVSMLVTQCWRVLSEFLRADWRGTQSFSAYQWLALASAGVVMAIAVVFPAPALPTPSVAAGLGSVWRPEAFVAYAIIGIGTVAYMGRSTVTTSQLSFHIVADAH